MKIRALFIILSLIAGFLVLPVASNAEDLPMCVYFKSVNGTLKSTEDPNRFQAEFSNVGVVSLWISNPRFYQISTKKMGNWSCIGSDISFVFDKEVPPKPTTNNNADNPVAVDNSGNQDSIIQEQTQKYDPKATTTDAQNKDEGDGTCGDGKDNSVPSDGKADYYGVDTDGDGVLDLEPDPSCIAQNGTEKADEKTGSTLISCYNYCTFSDVIKTINNLITFLITRLFVPIVILLFMYAGYQYIMAQGNPSKTANLKKLVFNILIGMLLVLCSWLIVKVIMTVLVKDKDSALQFLE